MSADTLSNPRPRSLIPYAVLVMSGLATVAMAAYVASATNAKDRAQFEIQVERNQLAIQRRLETYVNLLRGAAGLYAAQDSKVTLKQFRAYIERLSLATRYPGVQGIGVSGMAAEKDLAVLTAMMRQQGIRDFEVHPPGPREQYHAIVYLEPQDDRNRQAIGYDMFTEPTRRDAMERARDTGNAATSGKVILVQELDAEKQPGFLIYFPIYFTMTTPNSLEMRRKTLGGFVFSPFRVNDFFAGIFGAEQFPSGISFAAYDGDRIDPASLLYRSMQEAGESAQQARFVKTTQVDVPGRKWSVVYSSGPQFELRSARGFASPVLAAGGVVSALLFLLTKSQTSARRRAELAAHELRRSEQELRVAKEAVEGALTEAQQASELKDQFLATVSHELRTPLNAILGWSQLLRRGRGNDPDDLQKGLETIERSAKAQVRLIDDLLDVSRIVAGKLRLEVHAVQLGPVIDAAIASVRLAADAKGVGIECFLDPRAGAVNGDAARLQQVVWNLLSNAVKFTPSGGKIKIELRQERPNACIVVSDTGLGIAQEFLPHVFERFRQADSSSTRRYGGLGLGLGIVRHLTELHGGTVHVTSAGPNQGSTFTVSLPLAYARAMEHPPAALMPADGPSLRGIRVLVVEDDRAARELIERVLKDSGASVESCSSVDDGLHAFQQRRPDVIVSDIGMPDKDGYSFVAAVVSLTADRRVPAIALTALARAEDRQRALEAGFQLHIAKPFEPRELSEAIAKLVRENSSAN